MNTFLISQLKKLHQESKEYYSDEFVKILGEEFSIDASDIEILSAIYEIPLRYNLANSIAEEDRERGDPYKDYLRLQKKFRSFMDELYSQGGEKFNLEIFRGQDLDNN